MMTLLTQALFLSNLEQIILSFLKINLDMALKILYNIYRN